MTSAATAPPLGSEADAPEKSDSPKITVLHRDYFEQIMPTPPTICGLRLKPLSIGRYRLMHRHKVAFVADVETIATAGDLLMGVLICSMRCDDFAAFVESKNFNREVQRWGARVGFFPPRVFSWPVIGKWLEKYGGTFVSERDAGFIISQIQTFQKYITDGAKAPAYWDESSDGRVSASHWSQSIESVLREYLGWTREEINEEPLNKALWDYFKNMENHGLVRLMTDAERVDMETPLTPEELAESTAAMEKLWRYKFGDTPMPTEANPNPEIISSATPARGGVAETSRRTAPTQEPQTNLDCIATENCKSAAETIRPT